MVIANVKYQSPKGKGAGKLKGILRYLQYRNDRGGHIPQEFGIERWTDRGLGGNFQTIAANCEQWKSDHVQAFTLVINPNPDLIGFVPEEQREQFTRELTENTITKFFEERDLDIEWSYVLHRRETKDAFMAGRDNPHTHIILPGTYDSWADGGRLPFYMNRNKKENHIELLHTIAESQMENLLEHYVGLDWEQYYDALLAERQQPFEQLHTQFPTTDLLTEPDGEPHGNLTLQDGTAMRVWIGSRDDLFEDTQQVGFICVWEAGGESQRAFLPKVEHLSPEKAQALTSYILKVLDKQDFEAVMCFVDAVGEPPMLGQPEENITPNLDL